MKKKKILSIKISAWSFIQKKTKYKKKTFNNSTMLFVVQNWNVVLFQNRILISIVWIFLGNFPTLNTHTWASNIPYNCTCFFLLLCYNNIVKYAKFCWIRKKFLFAVDGCHLHLREYLNSIDFFFIIVCAIFICLLEK